MQPVKRAQRCLPAETRLQGVPLSPGVAVGRACFYIRQFTEPHSTTSAGPRQEAQRLLSSLKRLARQRSVLAREAEAKLGQEHAEIFQFHCLMLADEDFKQRLLHAIEVNGCSAEQVVETELNLYKEQLGAADSAYLQQRVADIDEIQQALLGYLKQVVACRRCKDASGCSVTKCQQGYEHILIGEELTASLPIETDDHTIGYIIEKGGPNCHAVILARALRRPVIGNIPDLPMSIPVDAQILINGDTGELILNPTTETLALYHDTSPDGKSNLQVSEPVPALQLMANIELSGNVSDVLAAGAEGIGLYRTEMEFLVAGRLLNETEQAARYSEVVKAMAGKPVCIRLLDLGDDKTAAWLVNSSQDEEQQGYRGARLLLARPELLHEQARAIAQASRHGPIHVLYPMINSVEQFLELRALFDESVADMQTTGLQHGVLFEVPAACLAARQMLEVADFGCIGTNDLIQYLFAEDRGGGEETSRSSFENDAVLWDLIQQVAVAALQAGKSMAICGELAANPDLTQRIMQAGITTVSTSPSHIAGVRRAARR